MHDLLILMRGAAVFNADNYKRVKNLSMLTAERLMTDARAVSIST